MLRLLTFRLLQEFFTRKDIFISFVCLMCDQLAFIYECFTYNQYVVCIRSVQKRYILLHPFVPNSWNIIHVDLFTIIIPNACVSGRLTSWMTLEIHSYTNLEVSFMFCKVPTMLWFLFDVHKLFCFIYILVGFNHLSIVITITLNGLGWCFPEISLRKLYRVNLYYIDMLKLST